MDKLEKFILENKAKFDEPRNPGKGWDRLKDRLEAKSTNWNIYWKVAAVIFFASTIVLASVKLQPEPVQIQVASKGTIEDFFSQQISIKKKEYQLLANEDQTSELLQDLEKMDEAYEELNESFMELNDPDVAEAMLENLRLRILILNEQIEILRNGAGEEEFYHSS